MTAQHRIDGDDSLRGWLPTLEDAMGKLCAVARQLPGDKYAEERSRHLQAVHADMAARIAQAVDNPVTKRDGEELAQLDRQALTLGQTIALTMVIFSIRVHQKTAPIITHVQGDWAMDEPLPVTGEIARRLDTRLQMVMSIQSDFAEMRAPNENSWRVRRAPADIDRLEQAAEALEQDLRNLLTTREATVTYGHYLHLETVLRNAANFFAFVLGNGPLYWLDGRPMAHSSAVH